MHQTWVEEARTSPAATTPGPPPGFRHVTAGAAILYWLRAGFFELEVAGLALHAATAA